MPIPADDNSYAFLDCGNGRRLERFSGILAERPAPAASCVPALPPTIWKKARLHFGPGCGWTGDAPENWRVAFGRAVLNLRPAGGGQLGVFPEHAAVCGLLEEKIAARRLPAGSLRILNLFAHTGLATLRLAAMPETGEVAHVDASRGAVRAARNNAAASGLADAPVRWLADDALAFAAREARRDRRYGLVLADPPAHGRDKKSGRDWNLGRDAATLLGLAAELLEPGGMLCLTCHSGGWDGEAAMRLMDGIPGLPPNRLAHKLALSSAIGGNSLPAGFMVLACQKTPPRDMNVTRQRKGDLLKGE